MRKENSIKYILTKIHSIILAKPNLGREKVSAENNQATGRIIIFANIPILVCRFRI